jgi:hypothetical protein
MSLFVGHKCSNSLFGLRRLAAGTLLLALLLAAGALAAPAASVAKGVTGSSSGLTWYSLVNRNSSACVDARGGNTTNGTPIQQWGCNNTYAQQFLFWSLGGGYFRIFDRSVGTWRVWDVSGASTAEGALIQLWDWNGGNGQQWQAVPQKDGYYHFVARNSGLCLDVPGASKAWGKQLQQYHCNKTNAQSFLLIHPGTQQRRGMEDKYQWFPWGLRVWIDHGATQNLLHEYAIVGVLQGFGDLIRTLKIPFPPTDAPSYVICLSGAISETSHDDVGYGVVMDLSIGNAFCPKVWGQ